MSTKNWQPRQTLARRRNFFARVSHLMAAGLSFLVAHLEALKDRRSK